MTHTSAQTLGVGVLEGIGEFSHAETHDENVQIVVSWAGDGQAAQMEPINITPTHIQNRE